GCRACSRSPVRVRSGSVDAVTRASEARVPPTDERRMLQAWLQERQYATPYHWRQRPNDEREYQLRTDVVLALAHIHRTHRDERRERRPRLLDVGCGDARFAAD